MPKDRKLPKDSWMKGLKGTISRKVNMSKLKPVGIAEENIQLAVEAYLQIKGLRYMHIPSSIYRICAPAVRIKLGRIDLSWGTKNDIRDYLKGVPDLLIFCPDVYKIGDEQIKRLGNHTLMLELKKLNAKARQAQINWHKGLHVHVKDTVELAIKLIEQWLKEIE